MSNAQSAYDTFTPKDSLKPGSGQISISNTTPLLIGGRAQRQGAGDAFSGQKKTGFVQKNAGLLMIMGSGVFACSMNLVVKKMNDIDPPVSTSELVVVRMGITYIFSMMYMLWTGIPDPWFGPPGVRFLLWFRGICGFVSMFGVYYSLRYLSLSDSTVLSFLTPLVTAITGALFLGEVYEKKQFFASVLSFFGVVLIARPAFLFGNPSTSKGFMSAFGSERGTPEERLIAVGGSMLGVLGAAGAYTAIRAIGKRAHAMHCMITFAGQCVLGGILLMYINGTPVVIPTDPKWAVMLLMIGFLGFWNQTLLTLGFQRETAGRGTLAIYLQIVYATILEFLFYHTWPSLLSWCGAFTIISSALYVALNKAMPPVPCSELRKAKLADNEAEQGIWDQNGETGTTAGQR